MVLGFLLYLKLYIQQFSWDAVIIHDGITTALQLDTTSEFVCSCGQVVFEFPFNREGSLAVVGNGRE